MRGVLVFAFVLAACDSPSPTLGRAVPIHLSRDGYDITVWRSGNRVEAIRHGMARRADMPHLRATLVQAMRDATGCAVRAATVEGDIGVLRARIAC